MDLLLHPYISFSMLFMKKRVPHKLIQYCLLLFSSEDEMDEANGNNPIDIEVEQNKESKKEVQFFSYYCTNESVYLLAASCRS